MSQSHPDLPPRSGPGADDFGELRSLLIGPEEAEIRGLKERLDDPNRFAIEVAKVLAPAMRHSAAQGEQLEQELVPSVEKAVRSWARDDPDTFSDAIFPLIGPVLRREIAASLRRFLRKSRWALAVLLVGFAGVVVWGWASLQSQLRWQGYLDVLAQQPGIVVTDARRTSLRGGVVMGLRDPIAVEPGDLAREAGLDVDRVAASWRPYQSLEPEIVLSRARRILDPPAGVDVELSDGLLVVEGVASSEWLAATRSLARAIPGIGGVEVLVEADDGPLRAFHSALAALAGRRLHFDADSAEPVENLSVVASEIVAMERLAASVGESIQIALVGRTDESGDQVANIALSLRRARRVHDGLRAAGVTIPIDIDGRGSFDPVGTPAERRADRNRSVTLELRPSG